MNEIQIFENTEFGSIRTTMINGEVWFVGKDVATALGYSNSRKAIADHVNVEDKGVAKCDTLGGVQNMVIINESGLYSLMLSSKLPTAKKFKRWVTTEILPSIRKTGSYNINETNPQLLIATALIEANKLLVAEKEKNKQLTVDNQIMKPKAEYFDELVDKNLLTNFRDTAKEFHIKQNEFIQFLIDKNYIYRDTKNNLKPYAEKNNGLFELKESSNKKTKWCGTQTLITPKGRETFRLLLKVEN